MIRKTIIVVLTLVAVGTATLVALSFCNPLVLDCLRCDRWIRVALTDGELCLPREKNNIVAQAAKNIRQHYRLKEPLDVAGWQRASAPRPLGAQEWCHEVKLSWQPYPAGLHAYFFRTLWSFPLPAALIVVGSYPSLAFIRGPLRRYRRRKRGRCVRCGYNLRGLTEPRCPECGTEVG